MIISVTEKNKTGEGRRFGEQGVELAILNRVIRKYYTEWVIFE